VPRYVWQRPDWPQWRWAETTLSDTLSAIQRKQDFLAGLAQGLDADHLNLAIAEFTTRETVSTSAIEGVTLDPDEIRSSIMRRLGLGISKVISISQSGSNGQWRASSRHTMRRAPVSSVLSR
jgi:Fic family protein